MWTRMVFQPWSEATARPQSLHYGSYPRERGWSLEGPALRWCQPRPPLPGQVPWERCALLPPGGAVRPRIPLPFFALPLTLPKLFSLSEEKTGLYHETFYRSQTSQGLRWVCDGSSARASSWYSSPITTYAMASVC